VQELLNPLEIFDHRIELVAVERDRRRMTEERPAVDAEVAHATQILAAPVRTRDARLDADLAAAERALAEAVGEDAGVPAAIGAEDDAVIRRLEAARRADAETARRRLVDAERTAATELQRSRAAEAAREAAGAGRASTAEALIDATAALDRARGERVAAEGALAAAEATAATTTAACGPHDQLTGLALAGGAGDPVAYLALWRPAAPGACAADTAPACSGVQRVPRKVPAMAASRAQMTTTCSPVFPSQKTTSGCPWRRAR